MTKRKSTSGVGYMLPPASGKFKKGESGNPNGRPKGSKSDRAMLEKMFLTKIRIKDNGRVRHVSKLVAAAEICMNNALKGDIKSFAKMMELADKFGLLAQIFVGQKPITEIRRVIIDPNGSKRLAMI